MIVVVTGRVEGRGAIRSLELELGHIGIIIHVYVCVCVYVHVQDIRGIYIYIMYKRDLKICNGWHPVVS